MSEQIMSDEALVGYEAAVDPLEAVASLAAQARGVFSFGYFDEVGTRPPLWWVQVEFPNTDGRTAIIDRPDLAEACDSLAQGLLAGGTCRCGGPITTDPDNAEGCLWRRVGDEWKAACA